MHTTGNTSTPPVADISGKGLSMKSLQRSQLAYQQANDIRIQDSEDKFSLLLNHIDKLVTVSENALTVAMAVGAHSTQLRDDLGKMGSEVDRLQRLIDIKTEENEELKKRVLKLEQKFRDKNLIIHGVPENIAPTKIAQDLFKVLKTPFDTDLCGSIYRRPQHNRWILALGKW